MFRMFLLALFLLGAAPAFASRPGGGPEPPARCSVMGEVVRIDGAKASVRLRETVGSSTYNGCYTTGADKMAENHVAVSVSLAVNPVPVIATGDVVFVDIAMGGDAALETFAPGEYTLNQMLGAAQLYFDDRQQRYQILYAVRAFLGTQQTIDRLVPDLIDADGDKRLGAALMLIMLADAKQPVPSEALQRALKIGLMESRKTAVGSSIRLYPGDKGQTVNMLEGLLRDRAVQDPFAAIVALGEIGPVAAPAVDDVIARMDDTDMPRLRQAEEETGIFTAAVAKMKAEDAAAKIFMARVQAGKLNAPDGPLAKGMCQLKAANADLSAWCESKGIPADAEAKKCGDAVASLQRVIGGIKNVCAQDADCDGFYFPYGGPECPPAQMLPKAGVTAGVREAVEKGEALIRAACAQQWEGKHAVCSPPVYHPACREGRCVDLDAR